MTDTQGLTLEGVRQFYMLHDSEDGKLETILDIFQAVSVSQAVIFVDSAKQCDELATQLDQLGLPVTSVHGDMEDEEQSQILQTFQARTSRLLVTTDLSPDVATGVKLVLNYGVPRPDKYLARAGTNGSNGECMAITLALPSESSALREIEKHHQTKIEELPEVFPQLL
ncbi:helicase-related protein [Streptomyces mirabilis]|uniref:helicase-related protein n=1 Tax=Streptomyces mirabilis TaxID=68239 RepID=UPI0036B37954